MDYQEELKQLQENYDAKYRDMLNQYSKELNELKNKHNFYESEERLPESGDMLDKLLKSDNEQKDCRVIIFEILSLRDINENFSHDSGQYILDFIHKIIINIFSSEIKQYFRLGSRYIVFTEFYDYEAENIEKKVMHFLENPLELIKNQSEEFIQSVCKIRDDIHLAIGISHKTTNTIQNVYSFAQHAVNNSLSEYKKAQKQLIISTTNDTITFVKEISKKIAQETLNFKDYFELYFQPQVDIQIGKVAAIEVLIRMKKGNEIITPNNFIPYFEANNQIINLGEWIIEEVFNLSREWSNDSSLRNLRFAINLSIKQLSKEFALINKIKDIQSKIIKPGFYYPKDFIYFEVTETEPLNEQAKEVLNKLIDMGYKIALDDFGTGYASLEHFGSLNYSFLKIDKELIQKMEADRSNYLIVQTAIILAKKLGMKVIAEGVELEESKYCKYAPFQYIYRDLQYLKCDYIQGYYFSEPKNLKNVKKWINNFKIENFPRIQIST
jgi:EAL domain-containing protein (putative c-di-GMP-specific phosphodiesterase class I)